MAGEGAAAGVLVVVGGCYPYCAKPVSPGVAVKGVAVKGVKGAPVGVCKPLSLSASDAMLCLSGGGGGVAGEWGVLTTLYT